MTGGYTLDVSNSALVREDLMINGDLKFLNNDTFITDIQMPQMPRLH